MERIFSQEGFDKPWALRGQSGDLCSSIRRTNSLSDVFTDVCFGPRNQGLGEEEIKARAREAPGSGRSRSCF